MGMTPTVAEIMTVPLVSDIKKGHPKLAIRVLSAFSGHLLDWLQRGKLELAVSEQIGRTILVENVAGAGGALGAAQVARAPADGSVLFIGTIAHVISPQITHPAQYDPVKDFTPSHCSSPCRTFSSLTRTSKRQA